MVHELAWLDRSFATVFFAVVHGCEKSNPSLSWILFIQLVKGSFAAGAMVLIQTIHLWIDDCIFVFRVQDRFWLTPRSASSGAVCFPKFWGIGLLVKQDFVTVQHWPINGLHNILSNLIFQLHDLSGMQFFI
ncbi:hypothetical protein ABZP36_009745 [Zizania latifolia]